MSEKQQLDRAELVTRLQARLNEAVSVDDSQTGVLTAAAGH